MTRIKITGDKRIAITASHIWCESGIQPFDKYLVHDCGGLAAVLDRGQLPDDVEVVDPGTGTLLPGLVDLQVNGGGGVLLNDKPTESGIADICKAHSKLGTGGLLPTLITSDKATLDRVIDAAIAASRSQLPGFLGLHLEGPHLSAPKKGIHSEQYIRPMTDEDVAKYIFLSEQLPALMITLAPENATAEQVRQLAAAGVIVSLGHTDAAIESLMPLVDAGASCVTHLYNAMSPLGSRAPGLVGLCLNDDRLRAGIIADGFHVSPTAIDLAFKIKQTANGLFLVSDAMHSVGSDLVDFKLDGQLIKRNNGRLTSADGTLAGADISLLDALTRAGKMELGVSKEALIRSAIEIPASVVGASVKYLEVGYAGPVIFLDDCWNAKVLLTNSCIKAEQ